MTIPSRLTPRPVRVGAIPLLVLVVALFAAACSASGATDVADAETSADAADTTDVADAETSADAADVAAGANGEATAAASSSVDTRVGDGDVPTADTACSPEHSGALIFLWHRLGSEHAAGSLTPSTPWGDGFYESASAQTAAYHYDLLAGAGADVALLSWWGTGDDGFSSHIDRAAEIYVQTAASDEHDISVAIFWEATSPRTLDADLARIAEFAASPSYLTIDGQPALFIYSRAWREIPDDTLAALTDDYFVVLEKFPRPDLIPATEGWTYWDIPWTDPDELDAKYDAVTGAGVSLAGFFMSGLDNSAPRAADEKPATVWPEGGPSPEWLRSQAEALCAHDPRIVVTPLNELGEHSAVEPTVEFGTAVYDEWVAISAELFGRSTGSAP